MKDVPFDFALARNTGVFVCPHVWNDGKPILYVCHEGDGDWQFLCGDDHAEVEPLLICLEDVVKRDPSVNALATLKCNHVAERTTTGSDWSIVDESEEKVRSDIAEYGWHIVVVDADDEGPGFAYSIGMQETLRHPEIIIFGLPNELMGWIINEIGAWVRDGRKPELGTRLDGLLEGAQCVLHPVAKARYEEFFGYALWYYQGPNFEALQCFWPGKVDGLFPWEPGSGEYVQSQQTDLRE